MVTGRPDWWFEQDTAEAALAKALGGTRLDGLGFEADDAAGLAAAGGILAYLEENEPAAVGRIDTLAAWRPGLRMEIDEASRRSLELLRSTATGRRGRAPWRACSTARRPPWAARLLGEWLSAPLVDRGAIIDRHEAVALLVSDGSRAVRLAEALAGIGDVERLVGRVVTGRAGPRDLERIGHATSMLPKLLALLDDCDGLLGDLRESLDPCEDLAARITATLREGCPC